jgi:NIMA (never in mitosis gene a)-related kinase
MASSPAEKTRYGDYEIVKPIGKGKFAVVYRAKRISNDEVVALKRINVDSIDDKARDKTLKEVGFLQSLDHPNIVKYMDSFINDNDLVIVFEWAAAGDLKRQVRKAQERGVGFDERVVWKYFSQICDAIQHMHERRIMHRDLKPANIFLTLDGTVKVGDLGLSREMSENTIQAHSKVGTPLYMSPEVLKGDGYDFKSDIWSLGCILYELAMLKSPFKAEGLNLYSLFQKISKGDYLPLPEQYSDELKDLAYKMISTNPEDRPEIDFSCDVARDMRVLYSDKQKAAKRQEEAQARVAKAAEEKERAAGGGGPGQQEDGGGGSGGGGNAAPAESKEQQQPISDAKAAFPNSSRVVDEKAGGAVSAQQQQQLGQDQGYIPSGRQAEAKHQEQPVRSATNTNTNTNTNTSSNPTAAAAGGGWADQGRAGGSSNPRGRDNRNGSRSGGGGWGDNNSSNKDSSSRAQQRDGGAKRQQPDAGYESPVDFHRDDEPKAMPAAAPVVTRRLKGSPSPSKEQRQYQATQQHGAISPESPHPRRGVGYDDDDQGGGGGGGGGDFARTSRQIDFDNVSRISAAAAAAGGQRGTRGEEVLQTIKDSFVSFALSDAIYQKLVVLQCPLDDNLSGVPGSRRKPNGQGRLLPMHFAVDLGTLGGVAGYSRGSQEQFFQFRRMVEVCIWLLLRIGGRCGQLASSLDLDVNTPTMIAKQLLMIGGETGISDEVLGQCTPSGIAAGYGDSVCVFLNALTDKCVVAARLGAPALAYPTDGAGDDGDNEDDVVDAGDEEEDDEEVAEDDDLGGMGASRSGAVDMYASGDEDDNNNIGVGNDGSGSPQKPGGGKALIASVVDPRAWAQETERVAPMLARARQERAGFGGGDWGDHLQSLRSYNEGFGPAASTETPQKGARGEPIAVIARDLGVLQRGMEQALEKVKKAENMLNVKSTVSRLSSEYGSSKKDLEGLEEKVSDKSGKMGTLGDTLATISDKLGEIQEEMEDRHGQGDGAGGSSSGGTHQVVRVRAALQRIKEEINAMSLTVGMTEALLLSKRMQHSNDRREAHRKKNKSRHAKRGKGAAANDESELGRSR